MTYTHLTTNELTIIAHSFVQKLKTMMLQMGQKPSQRKINQMMTSMKASYAKENSKKKK